MCVTSPFAFYPIRTFVIVVRVDDWVFLSPSPI